MAVRNVAHPSVDDRMATGGQARERTPPTGHAGWVPAADRPDPVALLEEQNLTREKDLVPVRHGRMMVSPFTFYRGAAKIMAADLKDRSGDPVAIAGYLGTSDAFDTAITDFSRRYSDQNERDYQQFVTAIRSGRLEVLEGV